MKKLNTYLLAATVAIACSSNVLAVQPPVNYVGASVGQAVADDFCVGGETSCDDTALSFRVHGGGKLNNSLSFEAGYRHIDEMDAAASFVSSGTLINAAFAMTGHFLDGTLLVGFPEEGPVKLHAKLGVVYWRLNYEIEASSSFVWVREEDADSGTAFRTGLALTYQASDTLRLRADWDLMLGVGEDNSTGETDVSVFSVGPEFLF